MAIQSFLAEHAQFIPFVLATRRTADGVLTGSAKLNTSRVLEGLVIAGITGAIVMYGVQQKLDAQLAELKAQMAQLQTRMMEQKAEINARENRLEDKLDSHVMAGRK